MVCWNCVEPLPIALVVEVRPEIAIRPASARGPPTSVWGVRYGDSTRRSFLWRRARASIPPWRSAVANSSATSPSIWCPPYVMKLKTKPIFPSSSGNARMSCSLIPVESQLNEGERL
jgi:hypothetical protein